MELRKSMRCTAASALCAAVMLCGAERSSNAAEAVPSVVLRSGYTASGVEYASASSQPPPNQAVTQYLKGLPHFANGTWIVTSVGNPDIRGAWETIYSFRNDSAVDASVTLRFFSPSGQLVSTPIKGVAGRSSDYAFTLPAGGAQDVELDKTADPVWVNNSVTSTGWAAFICDNADVKGQAFFSDYRYNLDGSVQSKLTNMVPLTSLIPPGCVIPLPASTPYSMPFYDNGMVSAYAFANTTAAPVAMHARFYDQQGVYLGTIDKTLPGFGQVSFGSTSELPLLDGKKGTMRLEGDGVIPLGFRFDSGTFATLMP
jgi:hypothetical protein